MHQLSNLLKINVKIDLEVNIVDMNKNKLEKKILQTKLGQHMLITLYNMVLSLKIKFQ